MDWKYNLGNLYCFGLINTKNKVIAAVIFANTFAAKVPLIKWSLPFANVKKDDSIRRKNKEKDNP